MKFLPYYHGFDLEEIIEDQRTIRLPPESGPEVGSLEYRVPFQRGVYAVDDDVYEYFTSNAYQLFVNCGKIDPGYADNDMLVMFLYQSPPKFVGRFIHVFVKAAGLARPKVRWHQLWQGYRLTVIHKNGNPHDFRRQYIELSFQ